MKGVVFTELLEMVEERYSLAKVDELLEKANLPSGGVFTAVGTYPPTEMLTLLATLSEMTGLTPAQLLHAFGKHLLGRFVRGYPAFFEGVTSSFALLERVDGYIHVEVRKLYPDAELPRFEYEKPAPNTLVMTYKSPRKLADLAHGLIEGTVEHFGEKVTISREDLSQGRGEVVRFSLVRSDA